MPRVATRLSTPITATKVAFASPTSRPTNRVSITATAGFT